MYNKKIEHRVFIIVITRFHSDAFSTETILAYDRRKSWPPKILKFYILYVFIYFKIIFKYDYIIYIK